MVGIHEPAGGAVRSVAAHLAGIRVEGINAVDTHLDAIVVILQNVHVGFAENDEQGALAGVPEVVRHVQVGIHARLQHRHAAEPVKLACMRVIAESAGNQHIKTCLGRLACGG